MLESATTAAGFTVGTPARRRKLKSPAASATAVPYTVPVSAERTVTVLLGELTPTTRKSPGFHFAVLIDTVSERGEITTSSVLVTPSTVTARRNVNGVFDIGNL